MTDETVGTFYPPKSRDHQAVKYSNLEVAKAIEFFIATGSLKNAGKKYKVGPKHLSVWITKYYLPYRGENKTTITLKSKV